MEENAGKGTRVHAAAVQRSWLKISIPSAYVSSSGPEMKGVLALHKLSGTIHP